MLAALVATALAFAPGESLDYDIRYGPMRLGRLELAVLEDDTVAGEPAHHFTARLDLGLGFLFQATYRLETWCRPADFITLRSAKQTDESRYQAEWTAEYNYPDSAVVYSDGDTMRLDQPARDPLTLWYWFRTVPADADSGFRVYCHTDRREYDVGFTVRPADGVAVPAGTFDCREFLPDPGSPVGSVFVSRADSGAALPVVIRTRVGSLTVSAALTGVRPGSGT